jgi:hypothetical protein
MPSTADDSVFALPLPPPQDVAACVRHVKACRRALLKSAPPPSLADAGPLCELAVALLGARDEDAGLDAKECALDLLACLSASRAHVDAVASALSAAGDGFETTFVSVARLDPSTAERLEGALLTTLLRVTSGALQAADLLEVGGGKVPIACDCTLALLRTAAAGGIESTGTGAGTASSAPPRGSHLTADAQDLQVAAARLFFELTLPETYFRAAAPAAAAPADG